MSGTSASSSATGSSEAGLSNSSVRNFPAYESCTLCPRNCGVNRNAGIAGFCRETADLRAAVACLHFGEEPPITVWAGSGTIFLTGCNLRCAFCQNYQISQCGYGSPISVSEFADMCLKLQKLGAENINIVTGSHAVPAIAAGLSAARQGGLTLPVCWNSSAYESVETLEMLKGLVDIWLPDLKTLNPMISDAVFKAADYPAVAKKAIRWMVQNTPARFTEVTGTDAQIEAAKQAGREPGEEAADGSFVKEKMLSGVIIRHLVLPGRMDDTRLVLDWLKKTADRDDDHAACISLMSQYTPVSIPDGIFTPADKAAREAALHSFSNRLLTKDEFHQIRDLIAEYDFKYLFYQELEQDTEWLPDFTRPQPFSYKLATPVWHC